MSNDIQRIQSNERLSRVVVHNGIAYLWGLRANGTKTYAKKLIHCLN